MFNMDAWRDYLERMRKADDTRWKSGGEGVSEHEIIITTGTTNKYDRDKPDRVNVELTLAARCQVLEAENAALKASLENERVRLDEYVALIVRRDERIAALEAENAALKAEVTQLEMETNLLSDVATRQTLLFEGADCANDILNDLSNELEAENAKLRAVLQAVEFVDGAYCPWCDRGSDFGHAPDCQRQAALSQSGVEK